MNTAIEVIASAHRAAGDIPVTGGRGGSGHPRTVARELPGARLRHVVRLLVRRGRSNEAEAGHQRRVGGDEPEPRTDGAIAWLP
jgi:hypothetical protein